MNWRAKAAIGMILLIGGALAALFMTGWLALAECDAECIERDNRTVAWFFLVLAIGITIGGAFLLSRGLRDRKWVR